jgi:hypothetical protein
MPALRWTTVGRPPDPAGVCTIVAVRLPLRSYRDVPRLVWYAVRIRRQLRRTTAVLGYAFALRIRQKTLWTVSAWSHRADLARFDRTEPHRTAKQALRNTMLPSTLVLWTCSVDRLPVPWQETHARIGAARAGRRTGEEAR